jgi:hypothetical protein
VPQPRSPKPVRHRPRGWVVQVLTISKLKRWSINYYIETRRPRGPRAVMWRVRAAGWASTTASMKLAPDMAAGRRHPHRRQVGRADRCPARGRSGRRYATTVHTAQGVTADTAHAVLGETASRATAYVAMSRGRDNNHIYIYTREAGEADHEHHHQGGAAQAHQMRRANKYAAAHSLRMILANDDRPITMHTHAEHTQHHQLPADVAELLDRNDERRTQRRETWRQHIAAEHARNTAHQRIISHDRSRGLGDATGSNSKPSVATPTPAAGLLRGSTVQCWPAAQDLAPCAIAASACVLWHPPTTPPSD